MDISLRLKAQDDASGTIRAVAGAGKSAFDSLKSNAVEAATKTQAAFETLKIKSADSLVKQKIAINAAYETIKNSATTTASEIQRAEQARANAIEQIDRENFATRRSLLAGFKDHWMAVTAATAAAVATIMKGVEYTKLAAGAWQAEESFHAVTVAYGEDGDALLSKMTEVSRGLIDDSDLMQKAVKSLQQHLTGNQIVLASRINPKRGNRRSNKGGFETR